MKKTASVFALFALLGISYLSSGNRHHQRVLNLADDENAV